MTGSQITPHGARLDQILSGMGSDFVQSFPQEGEIVHAPAKDGDNCFVNVHVGDTTDVLGPCPYQLRGTTLPKNGDRALVVTSQFGVPWIVAYWTYSGA